MRKNHSIKAVLFSITEPTQMNNRQSTSHSLNKYLWSAYCVPSTVLGPGDRAVNKYCYPCGAHFLMASDFWK